MPLLQIEGIGNSGRGNMEKGKRPRKFWDALGAWIIKLVSRCLLI